MENGELGLPDENTRSVYEDDNGNENCLSDGNS